VARVCIYCVCTIFIIFFSCFCIIFLSALSDTNKVVCVHVHVRTETQKFSCQMECVFFSGLYMYLGLYCFPGTFCAFQTDACPQYLQTLCSSLDIGLDNLTRGN